MTIARSVIAAAGLLVLLGAVAHAADGATPVPPAPLTIEEATAKPVYWGLDLSPTGRYLAAIRRRPDDVSVVVVADLDSADAPKAMPLPDVDVQYVHWVTDDRLLFAARYWLDDKMKVVPPEKATGMLRRMFAMDRDGGNAKLLFADNRKALRSGNLANVVSFRSDDLRHIVMTAWQGGTLDLFSVDVFSGESRRIAKGTSSTFLWFADRKGKPALRLDLNWSGSTAHVYARNGPADVDPADLEWEKIYTIKLRGEDNNASPDFYPLYAGPEPHSYYVAARPEGADTIGIYLYDYEKKTYLKTLASDPGVDIDYAYIDEDTGTYLGYRSYTDRKTTRLTDPKAQAHFNALDRYFGGEVDFYLTDLSDDQQAWLLFSEGPRDPGTWHVYRLKDKFVREIGYWLPHADPKRLGTTTALRYHARDGLEIMGYLTVPPGYRAGDQPPLILLPHGGPERRDYFGFDPLVQLLATRGYQVFQPNFRGSSGFGKRFAEMGYRQWGAAMQDDLTDAMGFLLKEGRVAKDRACIVGGSYGGYAALAGATLTPDLYRCAVSVAGVSHLRDQIQYELYRFRGDGDALDYVKREMGDLKKEKAGLDARSPANLAGAAKIPILLIHGTEDGIVPIEQAKLMDKALRKAGKDVRFVEIKDMHHSPEREEWPKVYQPLLEFLENNLPVQQAATTPAP